MRVEYFSNDIVMNVGIFFFGIVFSMLLFVFGVVVAAMFRKKTKKAFTPKISVIIPAYNEERNIARCLGSVFSSQYEAKKIEVIVVDDGSTDGTASIVKRFGQKVMLIKGRHSGKTDALNLGLTKAKNEIIVTLDADTIIEPEFLREIVAPLADKEVGAVNGTIFIEKPKGLLAHFQSIEYLLNNIIRDSFSKVFGNGIWFFGAAAAYRKSLLTTLKGFSKDNLTEDMDISLKIFEHGFKVIAQDTARYSTDARKTISQLFEQRMRWFYGGLQCLAKHKKLLRKESPAIKYLFFNQVFWTVFSFVSIPLIIYQVNFWMPAGFIDIAAYLARWFSLAGPVYVLWKIPVWGLSFINIFGVVAGLISASLIIISAVKLRRNISFGGIAAIMFYFPYTILLNAILIAAVFKGLSSKKKHFIRG